MRIYGESGAGKGKGLFPQSTLGFRVVSLNLQMQICPRTLEKELQELPELLELPEVSESLLI